MILLFQTRMLVLMVTMKTVALMTLETARNAQEINADCQSSFHQGGKETLWLARSRLFQ